MLDAQEYLHLAIKSSQEGQHQKALEQLRRCLDVEPGNATATFLLAAEHAELGMFDRAIDGMEKAINMDPDLEMAKLQLGMLYAQQGANAKAIELWSALGDATNDPSLVLFAKGFSLLCEGQTEQAVQNLRQGMSANKKNPALNLSIAHVMNSVETNSRLSGDDQRNDKKEALYLGAYSGSAIGDRR